MAEALETLEREHHALDKAQHGSSRERIGRLGVLPKECDALDNAKQLLLAENQGIDAAREAAALALELCQALGAGESGVLEALAQAAGKRYAHLSGLNSVLQGAEQAMRLTALDSQALHALDKQAQWRRRRPPFPGRPGAFALGLAP